MGNDTTTNETKSPRSVAERLRDAPWKSLSVRLTRYAFACIRHRSWHDAEDLAQEAIARAFDREYKAWDPEVEPDLFIFLAKTVKGLASNRRQQRMSHKEVYIGGADVTRHMLPEEPAEGAIGNVERAHVVTATVRERAAKDELVLKVLALLEARVDTIREQAEHIGCTMDEARSARRRLGYLVKKVQAELDARAGDES